MMKIGLLIKQWVVRIFSFTFSHGKSCAIYIFALFIHWLYVISVYFYENFLRNCCMAKCCICLFCFIEDSTSCKYINTCWCCATEFMNHEIEAWRLSWGRINASQDVSIWLCTKLSVSVCVLSPAPPGPHSLRAGHYMNICQDVTAPLEKPTQSFPLQGTTCHEQHFPRTPSYSLRPLVTVARCTESHPNLQNTQTLIQSFQS